MRAICIVSVFALAACTAPSGISSNGGNDKNGGNSMGGGNGGDGGSNGTGGGGSASDGGGGGGSANDAGTINGGGSTSGLLTFAVFGDARPPNQNDTTGYPSEIVNAIFASAQSKSAQFMIGTGDYMFATQASAVDAQIPLLQKAESAFHQPIYLGMGNHECNGYTDSNCPNLNETPNVQGFVKKLLPAGVSLPYYRVDVTTPLGKAKFLFIAANAWSSAQGSWLKTQLADPTTYTFAIRHEPTTDNQAPGVSPSEALLDAAPYTIEFLGHTHEYRRVDTTHVISGNGGAPLSSSYGSGSGYGYLLVQQQSSGDISVTEIDEMTGSPTDTWMVTAKGQAAK